MVRWMNLELVIQSEKSEREENKYYILMPIRGIEKSSPDGLICREGMETHIENKLVDTSGEEEGRTNRESSIGIHTLWHEK